MKNGPELWNAILSHFPKGSFLAGGALRDYVLGVEPKDFDVFVNYVDYDPNVEGMKNIDYDSDEHAQEYEAVSEIAIVMKGEVEGVKVDFIGIHEPDPVKVIESFDTGISQIMYAAPGMMYKKAAFVTDLENKTVTVLRGDRMERTVARFKRFNEKMDGQYTLVVTPEAQQQADESVKVIHESFDEIPF